MWDYELRSARERRRAQAGQATLYAYHPLPQTLLTQIILLWEDTCGVLRHDVGRLVRQTFIRQTGRNDLEEIRAANDYHWCTMVLRQLGDHHETETLLDLIELSFDVIETTIPEAVRTTAEPKVKLTPEQAVAELNRRFQQHDPGYHYVDGEIIRVDNQFVHAEMVEPAIALLHEQQFRGPSDEYLRAHEHYRHGRHREAIREALNAFESTMKSICQARGWAYDPGDAARRLIVVVLREGLIPSDLQNQFSQLASLMEGVATVRNRRGGHGQGPLPVDIPDYFAAYALHLAASNIVLLVEAHKALP